MNPLDMLFLPVGDESFKPKVSERKKGIKTMNVLARLWHNVGVMVALSVAACVGCAWFLHINPLAVFVGDDVRSILEQDRDMLTLYSQMKRYCEPNPIQRFGNGFDAATCKDKLDAMVAYRASKQDLAYMGPNADQDMRINEADHAFRQRIGGMHNIEKLERMNQN